MEIKTSLDWSTVKDDIRRMGRTLPAFSHDFYKVTMHLDGLVKELGNLEIEVKTRKTHSSKDACKKKIKQINSELKLIEKIHLMSLLSR